MRLSEVFCPREPSPRKNPTHMAGGFFQRWRGEQRWQKIWETEVQRGFRLSGVKCPEAKPRMQFGRGFA